jgi:hypothetical protein
LAEKILLSPNRHPFVICLSEGDWINLRTITVKAMTKHLSINEKQIVIVDPTLHYSPTDLLVSSGEEYEFSATGKWADASIHCDANGWIKEGWYAYLSRFNQLRSHPYFLLCGNLAKRESTNFAIGLQRTIQIQSYSKEEEPYELFLFANDLCLMYWNNRALDEDDGGPMRVSIQRKK